jgi:hypothetical protein
MKLPRIVVTLALGVAFSAVVTQAQDSSNVWNFPDFTATQVFRGGINAMPAKVYLSGSSVRIDTNDKIATLYVLSDNKAYSLTTYPNGRQGCIVAKPEQAMGLPTPLEFLFGVKVTRSPAGTEVIEGHNCKIENVEVTRADGKTVESKVWEAQDLQGVPVKIELRLAGQRWIAVYKDIVLGAPDKALLTPPSKCTPFEKMWQVAPH